MKFLQEMIAKKRQAQASDDATPEPGEGGGFVLPKMSEMSGEATALPQARAPEPAPVIPIRQTEETQAASQAQPESLSWDVSVIDLSARDGAETVSRVPPMSVASVTNDEAPEVDPLEAIREEFGEDVSSEETSQPEDSGPLRLEPQDRVSSHDVAAEEDEPSLSAAIMASAEEAEDKSEEPQDAVPGFHGFQMPDAAPEEPVAEDLQDAEMEEHLAEDVADEEFADEEPCVTPEAEAEAPAMEEDEYEAPAGFAAPDGGYEDEEDAGMATHETQPKTAAEAAAALAQQFQQRKIWDLQPAQQAPAAAEAPQPEVTPGHRPEPEVETVQLSSEPRPEPAPAPAPAPATESLARMPVPPMAPSRPAQPIQSTPPMPQEPEPAPQPVPQPAPAPQQSEPQPAHAARPEPEHDDDLMGYSQPRRRAGRVKTRLLGFHKPDGVVDPISAAQETPDTAAAFPVGWIIVVDGPGRGASFTLTAGASKIGRGEDQAVRLDFGDTSISRDNHAVIAFDSEQCRFFMGHGGKANLVRLNDMPVLSTEGLEDGDLIRIGETTLKFVALCGPDFTWEDDGAPEAHAGTH